MLEVGEREVTLDDLWSIDLNKREHWTCISPGQMHRAIWKGGDDDDSYISSDQAADSDDDHGDEGDGTFSFEPIYECENSEEAKKSAKKEAKKAAKKAAKAGIKQEITHLKEKLGTDNVRRTPLMGESVADFYARTTDYWVAEAVKSGQSSTAESNVSFLNLSSKELKGQAFHLCKARYGEIQPVLDRLNELDALQKEAEKDKKSKSLEKGTKVRNK